LNIPQNFIDWACSFSGCDGGSASADYWFCGIEWGFGKGKLEDNDSYQKRLKKYYEVDLPEEIQMGNYNPFDEYDMKEHIAYPYGVSLAKLYTAMIGKDVAAFNDVVRESNGNEIFKMNLYPIAFRNTDYRFWQEHNMEETTGFQEKHIFRTWCFLHRFPSISEKLKQMNSKPKVIVGTGVSYLDDFFACFAGPKGADNIRMEKLKPKSEKNSKVDRTFYWSKIHSETMLFVVPFFSGQYGLNSNYLLQEMGNEINKISKLNGIELTLN